MEERYGCQVCGRDGIALKTNKMLRDHTANGKRKSPDNPSCDGSGGPPVRTVPPETDPNTIEDPATAAEAGAEVHVIKTGYDPSCKQCQQDLHACPGCGDPLPHGTTECEDCAKPVSAPVAASDGAAGSFIMGTAHNAPAGDVDPMDVLMAEDRPSDGTEKLYRNGRYALPDPVTGVPRTWTRATTMAETVSDLYSLNLWRIRMILIGVTRFPDLLDGLREIDGDGAEQILSPKIHREELNKVGLRAQEMAGAKVPANWGTEMHSCIEGLSRDEITLDEVPEKYRHEVAAWAAAMSEADLSAVPELIERRVAVPLYGTAGTLDQVDRVHRSRSIRLGSKIVRLNAGDHLIGDVKSGRDLDYGWGEIAIQMSIYARGLKEGKVARWDPDADEGEGAWVWDPIPVPIKSVRTDVGVVMHIPVQRGEDEPARCTLHWIDLEEGWKAVQLCEAVRDWRRAKGLNTPFSIAEVPTSVPGIVVDAKPQVRPPSWEERFSGVTTKDQARAVYREYVAAGHGSKDPETLRLVGLAKVHLQQLAEETA